MKYKTLNEYKEEPHPWKPFVPDNADKIILGTFPTREDNRGSYEFFYPNPNNDFWRLIFRVAGKDLDDYQGEEERYLHMFDNFEYTGSVGKELIHYMTLGTGKDKNYVMQLEEIYSLIHG